MIKCFEYQGLDFEVKILWPYRAPPFCMDPDNPAFGDVGDECDYEILKVLREGKTIVYKDYHQYYDDPNFYDLVADLSIEEVEL